jgi:hypothetical protein
MPTSSGGRRRGGRIRSHQRQTDDAPTIGADIEVKMTSTGWQLERPNSLTHVWWKMVKMGHFWKNPDRRGILCHAQV